jgi:hypothetical protein
MKGLHTLLHQQVRWQYSRDEARLFRALHIYDDHELAPIFEQTTGLSVGAFFAGARHRWRSEEAGGHQCASRVFGVQRNICASALM